jgi:predicted metalloprotease with PDZ domain
MLALLHQASQKEIVLTNASLAAHFSAYVGSDATRDVQKYIDEGETLPFASASASASDATVR